MGRRGAGHEDGVRGLRLCHWFVFEDGLLGLLRREMKVGENFSLDNI